MEQLIDFERSVETFAIAAMEYIAKYTFSVLGAILVLIIGFFVAGLVRRWLFSGIMRTKIGDETLAIFVSKTARYVILIIVFVMVLSQFGVQTASIIAALGAAGLAIGLALQGTLQNVASGLVLLVLRPFKIGDYVDCGGTDGIVQEIGLFATEFRTLDGLYRLVPNSSVWGSSITNFSHHRTRRFDLVIGIGYDDDIDKAMEIMSEIVAQHDTVLNKPEPYLFVENLGDSAVMVTCRVWIKTPDWWVTTRDLVKEAKQAFDKAGISIPYPQRDVHIYEEKIAS